MQIDFKIIPHKKQRYDTVGDYYKFPTTDRFWFFRVSRMKDRRYAILVFLHEVVEFFLCRMAGIKMRDIDKWDMEYEKRRDNGECLLFEEPGDDPHAPYHHQHICASRCERLIAQCAGVNWDEYCDAVRRLSFKGTKANKKAA